MVSAIILLFGGLGLLAIARAAQDLGWSTSRCVLEHTFSYAPSRERGDRAFLAEPPEETVAKHLVGRDFQVELIQVFHHEFGGRAVASVRLRDLVDSEEVRTFHLAAGRSHPIYLEVPLGRDRSLVRWTFCYSQLGMWRLTAGPQNRRVLRVHLGRTREN